MVSDSIKSFEKDIEVKKVTGRSRVKGKFRETFSAFKDRKAAAIPGGVNDVVIDDNGASIQIDYKFYIIGVQDIPDRSIIKYQGVEYEVRGFIDRVDYGGFSIYKSARRR